MQQNEASYSQKSSSVRSMWGKSRTSKTNLLPICFKSSKVLKYFLYYIVYYVDVELQYWVPLALRECGVFLILNFKWKSNIWQQYDPHLIIFQCQTKDIGSVSGDGSSMRNKFGDSEIFMLQNLVHQECRNGVITENKLRKIYGDIFPMVCVHKSLLAWWEEVVFIHLNVNICIFFFHLVLKEMYTL